MKNKKLLIISLLILIIILSSYVIFKKQKGNIVTNTTITTNTTKLTLCSNEYYNTEYNKDGKIVIKDFPYRSIKKGEHCQDFEIMATLPFRFSGVIMSEEDRKDLENEYHICYPRDLSLSKISNLSCVQEITLSGMPIVGDMNEQVTNCFFANDDINQLSHLTNLEKIIFDSCSIRNIKSDWWKNLEKLEEISIIFPVFGYGEDVNFDRISSNKWVDDILDELLKMQKVNKLRISAKYMGWFPLLPSQYKKICVWAETSKKDLLIFRDNSNIIIKNGKFIIEEFTEGDNPVDSREMSCEEWIKYDRERTDAESWGL